MTKIKICGLMRSEDVEIVNDTRPDLTGFIFAKGRRRYISPETALDFRKMLDPQIRTVGVFVNESPDVIYDITKRGIIDLVQLHGQENDAFIQYVRDMTGLPVIKSFSIRTPEDVQAAACSDADIILLDNGIGGTGESFDHELLKEIDRPYFLAGGLTPENAAENIRKYSPYGLDVSSGVESGVGFKDPEKVKKFVDTVRSTGA